MARFSPAVSLPPQPDFERGIAALFDLARTQSYIGLERERMAQSAEEAARRRRGEDIEYARAGIRFGEPPTVVGERAVPAQAGVPVPIRRGPPPMPGSFNVQRMGFEQPDPNYELLLPAAEGMPPVYQDIRKTQGYREEQERIREREETEREVGGLASLLGQRQFVDPRISAELIGRHDVAPSLVLERTPEYQAGEREAETQARLDRLRRELEIREEFRPEPRTTPAASKRPQMAQELLSEAMEIATNMDLLPEERKRNLRLNLLTSGFGSYTEASRLLGGGDIDIETIMGLAGPEGAPEALTAPPEPERGGSGLLRLLTGGLLGEEAEEPWQTRARQIESELIGQGLAGEELQNEVLRRLREEGVLR